MIKIRVLNYIWIAFISCLFAFTACEADFDGYSTSSGHQLSFSTDTLSADTILSMIPTTTFTLKVYNRNKERLLISSIDLEKGTSSEFRINVGGRSDYHFTDIEIEKEDSIYIFVEATIGHTQTDLPVLVRDRIRFLTNTNEQFVVLEAYGQNVNILRGEIVAADTIFNNRKPYLIYDSLFVREGVSLQLDPGVILYFYNNANLIISGTLKAIGTLEQPITLRGNRLDYMVNVPYDRVPGQWGGIRFKSSSFNNEMEYVQIRNGSYGILFETSDPEQSKLTIRNTTLTNCSGILFDAINCQIEGSNCEFSNAGRGLMRLTGGNYSFTHCTLTNYYSWESSLGNTLTLSNKIYDNTLKDTLFYSLSVANFKNSIIYGRNSSSAISFEQADSKNHSGIEFNYLFSYCLLSAKETAKEKPQNDDKNYFGCIFNENPKFQVTGESQDKKEQFIYDFRLDSVSVARNAANPETASFFPLDKNNIPRTTDDGPDMGAYEWVPKVPEE